MRKPRKLFTRSYSNGDKSVMMQPWEYEAEGFKRLGLLLCVSHGDSDAVAHPLTQKEVRAVRRYLNEYESFIRNSAPEGYDSKEGE